MAAPGTEQGWVKLVIRPRTIVTHDLGTGAVLSMPEQVVQDAVTAAAAVFVVVTAPSWTATRTSAWTATASIVLASNAASQHRRATRASE